VVIILFLFGWFFTHIFEGEKPRVSFKPKPVYLADKTVLEVATSDGKRGLRVVKASIHQASREIKIFERTFPFNGMFNREGVHHFQTKITIDPRQLNLAQGEAVLRIRAWDYSKRGGGDGNLTILEHRVLVDTIPPALRAVTRMHNINQGGTGLAIYQTSTDTAESGLYVNGHFFPGYPVEGKKEDGYRLCYFAVPHDAGRHVPIFLWSRDKAGNETRSPFNNRILKKKFRKDRMNLSDRFFQKILPYFSFFPMDEAKTPLEKYLLINNKLRQINHKKLDEIGRSSSPERLWDGVWVRLKNAATMARFADHRHYYYKGKKVDEKFHLGVDLASLAHSPVEASNNGRVVFAEKLGIYGLTVILDHGQGLTSLYGHLSKIDVTKDQNVKKGEIIGLTGSTGLAGGDHLHFGIMVHGVPVNPVEWWDSHWIKDNVERKLALLK
jgi:hypothetical protein